MSIRIILVDDHVIVREGLRSLIEKRPDMQIVGEAGDGRNAVEMARKLLPDVVLMDVSMPDMNGIEATRNIRGKCPGVKVLVLSMHFDRKFAVEMLKAGASGYLLKDAAFEELITAIRAVLSGHTYLCHGISDAIIRNYVDSADMGMSVFSILTTREREVLQLITEGNSTKEIASILRLSVKTVETYRKLIMEKLDLHSIAELTKYAIREGLTSLES